MPVCAFFFGVMVLSLMGLPVLGGFVGDLFVLLGSLETRRTLSVFALLAMVVAASYLLWVQRRLFLGPVDEPANRGLIDLDRLERGILLAITLPIIAIGVYPNPVLRRVEPAVLELLYQMERRSVVSDEAPEPSAPGENDLPSRVARRGRGAASATLDVARIGERP
jgi:NADH-quinone oxidoreductase subunit M